MYSAKSCSMYPSLVSVGDMVLLCCAACIYAGGGHQAAQPVYQGSLIGLILSVAVAEVSRQLCKDWFRCTTHFTSTSSANMRTDPGG